MFCRLYPIVPPFLRDEHRLLAFQAGGNVLHFVCHIVLWTVAKDTIGTQDDIGIRRCFTSSNDALALFCGFFESIVTRCNPFELIARECGFQEGVALWIKILHFLGDMNRFNLHMLCNKRYNLLKTWYTEF